MSIWDLYRKPPSVEGSQVEGLNARYYTGRESEIAAPTNSSSYWLSMGAVYFVGVVSYIACSRYGMRAQRLYSSLIITSVPTVILLHKKGDDNTTGLVGQRSLEEKLDYYPLTRRALERAIQDVSQEKKL